MRRERNLFLSLWFVKRIEWIKVVTRIKTLRLVMLAISSNLEKQKDRKLVEYVCQASVRKMSPVAMMKRLVAVW